VISFTACCNEITYNIKHVREKRKKKEENKRKRERERKRGREQKGVTCSLMNGFIVREMTFN